MKTLPLTRGAVALIDDSDLEFLNQWKWTAFNCSGKLYAARKENRRLIFLHRFLMGVEDDLQVDHWDGCSLNNQKSNLRVSNQSQNMGNRRMSKNNSSGFKGVSKRQRKDGVAFHAVIGHNGKAKHIGAFRTPEEAAKAYDDAAVEQWGQFARTNKSMNLL